MSDEYEIQAKTCIPLIEEERAAFIKKEHGRLQAVIGIGYWDPETKTEQPFHVEIPEGKEEEFVADPYELDLGELARLTGLVKRVERIGTVSYLAFFQMFPEDKERIALLYSVWFKLKNKKPCAPEEIKALVEGHEKYMAWKLDDGVKVIK